MTESQLREKVCRYFAKLKSEGEPIEWKSVLGSAMQRRGEPDLDVCYHGKAVKIELKVGNKVPTKLQEHRLKQWHKAGAVCSVAYSVEDVSRLLMAIERIS